MLGNVRARGSDSAQLGRIGDDILGILLHDAADRADVTGRIERLARALDEPVDLNGRRLTLQATFGVALSPDDGSQEASLMDHARAALESALRFGDDRRVVFYSDSVRIRALSRMDWLNELAAAIERDRLELHYQPRFDLRTGELTAVEALLRWPHPARGYVPLDEFLPLAEASALAVPLGRWVIRRACTDFASLADRGQGRLRVSVNLGRQYGTGEQLAKDARRAAVHARISLHQMDLEITERMLMGGRKALECLQTLREQGARILVDDFGTGFVSLGRIGSSPIDALKIDRSFIEGIGRDQESRAVCRAALALGHAYGLRVIVEGVETEEQRSFLASESCDEAQGYLFCPPLPLEQLLADPRFQGTPAAQAPEEQTT
jgi:EAL domain-containing protein (putative c-di-GMP-specific phosphodiesterase class I)